MIITKHPKRLANQLNIAAGLLNRFDGSEPFHLFITRFFRTNKQFGSGDRRFYKAACYAFWRFGQVSGEITAEQIAQAIFLQNSTANSIDENEMPGLLELAATQGWTLSPASPQSVLGKVAHLLPDDVPIDELSLWLERSAPVYLLPFPDRLKQCRRALAAANLPCDEDGLFLKVDNSPVIQSMLDDGLCRIQDKASTAAVLGLEIAEGAHIWDCCCGAGGKSLTLQQFYKDITLCATDNRQSVLLNLAQRFELAGLPAPVTSVVDLSQPCSQAAETYDVIFADVPCSGSGTWRHTPEQAHFFDESNLESLVMLQRSIVTNAIASLKVGGILAFVTCSVFRKENEDNLAWLQAQLPLALVSSEILGGSSIDADYLFRAVFRKMDCHVDRSGDISW